VPDHPPAAPATTHWEVERKYRVHGLYRLPDLVAAGAVVGVEDLGSTALDATYYDTDDLRLAREGITLRRRVGGDDEGWHLKLPVLVSGGAGVREEIQLPLDAGGPDEVAGELRHLVGALVRSDELRPVATLRTERHTFRLWAELPPVVVVPADESADEPADEPADESAGESAGEPTVEVDDTAPGEHVAVALLTDDVVSVLDNDGRMAARFRELELEDLPDADPVLAEGTAAAVSEALATAGAVGGEFVSKAVRALGPFAAAPPEVPEPPVVTPADAARDAVRAHIARHTLRLRGADIMVRRDLPDGVHQMRVAARRLRSGLRVFRPLLDQEWADSLRDELAWVAGELGDYRDTEVLLERLERHLDLLPDGIDPQPARVHVETVLTERLSQARERALAMLSSKRYYDLHVRLIHAAADPVTTELADAPGHRVIPPLVDRAWKKLAKEATRLLADEQRVEGGAPDAEWHVTRISAKKARYAAEAAAPVFGPDAAAYAKQLSLVTEVLGDHQDAAIACQRIHELAQAEPITPPAAFGLGALLGVERDSARETRGEFSTVWAQVSRRSWRRWLRA
jgi:CHAD domain-containing protein